MKQAQPKELTIREVQRKLEGSGCKLYVHFEHGDYHAYAYEGGRLRSYDRRADLVQVITAVLNELPGQAPCPVR